VLKRKGVKEVKEMNDEIQRIIKVYSTYGEDEAIRARWALNNPGNQAILRERQQAMQEMLMNYGFWPLDNLRILDVGCGRGDVLASLQQWGAKPENLYGVDLLQDRIEEAKRRYPDLNFLCANAEHLEFSDGSFDLVLLFTVFSSILDDTVAQNIAKEIARVLRPSGAVLWYDFRYNNPWNPNVRGMTTHHIHRFFPEFEVHLRTITLLPPLARRLGRLTPVLYPFLVAIPILRTHYLALLMKRMRPNDKLQMRIGHG